MFQGDKRCLKFASSTVTEVICWLLFATYWEFGGPKAIDSRFATVQHGACVRMGNFDDLATVARTGKGPPSSP